MKKNNVQLTDSELEFLIWACGEIRLYYPNIPAELKSKAEEMRSKLRGVYLS